MHRQEDRSRGAAALQREQAFQIGERVRYLGVLWEAIASGMSDRGGLQRLRDEVWLLIAAAAPLAPPELDRTLHALAQSLATISPDDSPPSAPQRLRVHEVLVAVEALAAKLG